MVYHFITIQLICFIIGFLYIIPSFCFLYHRSLHSQYSINCLYDTSQNSNKIIPADEEIVKKLVERHKDEIQKYLDPLSSGLGNQISEQEIEDTFGKPLTPENLAKRERQSFKPNPYELPNVPPTNKLPYFVNFEFPQNQSNNVISNYQDTKIHNSYTENIQNINLDPSSLESNIVSNINKSENLDISENLDDIQKYKYDKNVKGNGYVENNKGEIIDINNNEINIKIQNKENIQDKDKEVESLNNQKIKQDKNSKISNDKKIVSKLRSGLPIDLNTTDPLRSLIDRNEDYPDLNEEYGPKWYLSDKKNELTQIDLEDGWSILPCGKVYKHILQPSQLSRKYKVNPNDESCITFMFKMLDAKTNTLIVESEDVGGSLVTTYMNELSTIFQKCLKAMNTGEQAEFIFHVSEYNPDNMIIDELTDVIWIRLWINLWESHNPNERWWGLGPGDAHLYPEKEESKLSKKEKLEQETDELTSQIETELNTNPVSPLWADVMHKMTSSQKESFVEHFDRKLENIEKMKCSEFSGSRAFGENIKSSGQFRGYDVGHQVGGVSKFYTWRETPFMMYIAIPVIPGVRSEHVKLNLSSRHLTLFIADKVIIDDDLTDSVDLDTTGVWAMSDSATEHPPLDRSDERLSNPTVNLTNYDQYDRISKRPSILIFLKKSSNSIYNWGVPFVNT